MAEQAAAERAFIELNDENGDELVSYAELCISGVPNMADCHEMDSDNDGSVSLMEFKTWYDSRNLFEEQLRQ